MRIVARIVPSGPSSACPTVPRPSIRPSVAPFCLSNPGTSATSATALLPVGSDWAGPTLLLLLEPCCHPDALAARLRKGHVAPVEGRLLPVVLAQGARDRGLHQLLAEVEGVRGLVDPELVEDLVEVGSLDEELGVEDVDPVAVGEDAEVRVRDLGVQFSQLRF